MLQKVITCLTYEETQPFIKKNVVTVFQISMMLGLTTSYHVYVGNLIQAAIDLTLLSMMAAMWYLIAKHDKYYPHIFFLLLVPMVVFAIGRGIVVDDLVELYWVYCAIILFFLVFAQRLAVAAAVLLAISTTFLVGNQLNRIMLVNYAVSVLAMIVACRFAFKNMYKQYDTLENRANTDPLTQLYNRSLLPEKLNESIANVKDKPPVLLCVDVDFFKKVNDTYGHHVGDAVLLDLAKLFRETLQKTDTIFRLGGEEFLVLMQHTEFDNAREVAERLRSAVEESHILPDGNTMTISVGVAQYDIHDSWNGWLKHADDAMYLAKRNGRNKVMVSDKRNTM